MEELWSAVLPRLREQLGERNFCAWIEPIRCHEDGDGMRLEVPSRFFQEWLTRHFLPTIRETVAERAGKPLAIRVVVADGAERPAVARSAPESAPPERSLGELGRDKPHAASVRRPKIGRLIPHYTFRSFVVGAANEVAFQAVKAVGEEPGKRFNPVFLHGGVGLGKTHLVNALGHDLLRRRARMRIACLSAESFMNNLIMSLRQDQMNAFRERFRQVDALILDDVQFLAGKERTQEEFFHTFNALYGEEKQIVLTSDKSPVAITGLEQRLRSRFEGGLIADILPPTREMRTAILRAKAAQHGVDLPSEIADLLVQRSGPSVRELEGALNRTIATAQMSKTSITLQLAEAAIGPYRARKPSISVEAVQEAVSLRFGVTIADLTSHRRARQLALPRQIAMYLSRTMAEASFPSIGEKFGGRDHSTVMYAVRMVEVKRAADAEINQIVVTIEERLRDEAM
jgi:chromosomal replication initiator protein